MTKKNGDKENITEKNEKTCFFITPIGEEGSKEFNKMEALSHNVIEPIIEKYGYRLIIAHNIQKVGSIGDQVFQSITESDLIISDLTGLNPNVMYETAVAHSFSKHTIMIVESGNTKLPFDVSGDRAIFFEDSIEGTGKLIKELEKKLEHIIKFPDDVDNPVIRVLKYNETLEKLSETTDDISSQMYKMILSMKSDLDYVTNEISENRIRTKKSAYSEIENLFPLRVVLKYEFKDKITEIEIKNAINNLSEKLENEDDTRSIFQRIQLVKDASSSASGIKIQFVVSNKFDYKLVSSHILKQCNIFLEDYAVFDKLLKFRTR